MPVSTVSIPVGQWFTSAEGVRWWFDSGSFALDFAYTGPMGVDPAWERLHAPDDLTAWLQERFPVAVGTARSRDLFDAISLRDAIGRMARASAQAHGGKLALTNGHLTAEQADVLVGKLNSGLIVFVGRERAAGLAEQMRGAIAALGAAS